jgi:hypothetical protein
MKRARAALLQARENGAREPADRLDVGLIVHRAGEDEGRTAGREWRVRIARRIEQVRIDAVGQHVDVPAIGAVHGAEERRFVVGDERRHACPARQPGFSRGAPGALSSAKMAFFAPVAACAYAANFSESTSPNIRIRGGRRRRLAETRRSHTWRCCSSTQRWRPGAPSLRLVEPAAQRRERNSANEIGSPASHRGSARANAQGFLIGADKQVLDHLSDLGNVRRRRPVSSKNVPRYTRYRRHRWPRNCTWRSGHP